jgi:hypothetical protein
VLSLSGSAATSWEGRPTLACHSVRKRGARTHTHPQRFAGAGIVNSGEVGSVAECKSVKMPWDSWLLLRQLPQKVSRTREGPEGSHPTSWWAAQTGTSHVSVFFFAKVKEPTALALGVWSWIRTQAHCLVLTESVRPAISHWHIALLGLCCL